MSNPYSSIIFSKLNKYSKSKKSRAITMKYFEKNRKPIPFLEVWRRDDEEMVDFWEKHSKFVRERNGQDNEQSQNARENWKAFENCPENNPKEQNSRFSWLDWVANKSPVQVAKKSCDKFWKICLSVFRDWKVHSQVSYEGSRETVWVNSQLELPLANQSLNKVTKMLKTQNFEIFSKCFSRLGLWLARESLRAFK